MATFDSNMFYQLSEGRVDKVNTSLASELHASNGALSVTAKQDTRFQLTPTDGVKGRYIMRASNAGVAQHLSACFSPTEPAVSKTGICMQPAAPDDAQKWDISPFGDGTFRIMNVKNGSNYVLDVHPGNPPFMFAGETNGQGQPAQHWLFVIDRPINDGAWSTIYGGVSGDLPTHAACDSSLTPPVCIDNDPSANNFNKYDLTNVHRPRRLKRQLQRRPIRGRIGRYRYWSRPSGSRSRWRDLLRLATAATTNGTKLGRLEKDRRASIGADIASSLFRL